jgi:hypothetical protein
MTQQINPAAGRPILNNVDGICIPPVERRAKGPHLNPKS